MEYFALRRDLLLATCRGGQLCPPQKCSERRQGGQSRPPLQRFGDTLANIVRRGEDTPPYGILSYPFLGRDAHIAPPYSDLSSTVAPHERQRRSNPYLAPSERGLSAKPTGGENLRFLFSPSGASRHLPHRGRRKEDCLLCCKSSFHARKHKIYLQSVISYIISTLSNQTSGEKP